MASESKTIVVTGASSGIGKATAEFFRQQGWNVVATMRDPSVRKDFAEDERLKIVQLDVQDPASIRKAVSTSLAAFRKIDVWVNNAGYGVYGPVEAASRDQIQRQYDVNVFGLIECVQAIAPHFRENRAGVLINVTSIGGLMTAPGYSIYNSSKFAVEGLSEGLWFELGSFGIRVKLVEPGVTRTDFGGRSMDMLNYSHLPDYGSVMEKINAARARLIKKRSAPELIAATIFQAANDQSDRLRYLAGPDAKRLWGLRRWLGYRAQMRIVRNMVKL
jgi:NAD(P)-dependent dehydrogenase (short-subunit alcohol dehydrogenase family)